MRIISGLFKGKKILEPKDFKTRPLKDLTKESIFNIINHSKKFTVNLKNSNILDLFSGVGSFGIECLSREAKKVVFIENYNEVLPILKKNLISIKSIKNYKIIENDVYDNRTFLKLDNKFDIIFLDPPYKQNELNKLIEVFSRDRLLSNDGILVIHRHKKQIDLLPKNFRILEKKIYWVSKILFGDFN